MDNLLYSLPLDDSYRSNMKDCDSYLIDILYLAAYYSFRKNNNLIDLNIMHFRIFENVNKIFFNLENNYHFNNNYSSLQNIGNSYQI
jgi:hypothetical protein